ncbi:MAG TPA: hypothetical protein DCE41_17325 [Cytophagales bacterium]|nr:hypothetical protein [Cytophagales bacterium]
MTFETYWEKYLNEDILDIYQDTCTILSQPLAPDVAEEYDFGEVILETLGHLEMAKRFEDVVRFRHLIQEHQPKLYQAHFEYFEVLLVSYYAYRKEHDHVQSSATGFIQEPLHHYELYLISFNLLQYYQYSDITAECIEKNFHKVAKSQELMRGAELDLAMQVYYSTLQRLWEQNPNSFDAEAFVEIIKEHHFSADEEVLQAQDRGLWQSPLRSEEMDGLHVEDWANTLITLQGYFFQFMHAQGVAFYLSGIWWDAMTSYWVSHNQGFMEWKDAFLIDQDSFEKFLTEAPSNGYQDLDAELAATVWGCVYVYAFLLQHGDISESRFQHALSITQSIKSKVMGKYPGSLWEIGFVHTWPRPQHISEAQWAAEQGLFQKSMDHPGHQLHELSEVMQPELEVLRTHGLDVEVGAREPLLAQKAEREGGEGL